MSTSVQHRQVPTTLGLSLGLVGIIGLAVSLLSILPINIYNMYLAANAAFLLIQTEYERTHQWWTFSCEALYYFIFLVGSVLSSLITTGLVAATCLAKRMRSLDPVDVEASYRLKKQHSSLWLSRMACAVFIGQIGWALFGNHLLWFVKLDMPLIHEAATLSVWILWFNYGVLFLFSFILFFASFFILLGTSTVDKNSHRNGSIHSNSHLQNAGVSDSSKNSLGEMQQQETTPLLKKPSCH